MHISWIGRWFLPTTAGPTKSTILKAVTTSLKSHTHPSPSYPPRQQHPSSNHIFAGIRPAFFARTYKSYYNMADNASDMTQSHVCHFFSLSNEILQLITSLLPNREVKNVRLSSKRLQANSVLRFDRVFISPNNTNLDVVRSIADHPDFRAQVKEIVWDDALLPPWSREENDESDEFGYLVWERECRSNGTAAELVSARTGAEPQPDARLLSQDENIEIYRRLYSEQQEIIAADIDADVLREILPKFPALRRVTVTPATYSPSIGSPYLETPMIRSFAPSFNFPQPSGWTRPEDEDFEDMNWQDVRETWRGFTVVLRELARREQPILELVLGELGDVNGVAYQLFQEPSDSEDLRNLQSVCRRGLQRLDLAITVQYFQFQPGLEILPSSRLRQTLEAATAIQHFSLRTNTDPELADGEDYEGKTDVLKAIPLESWPNLRHLELARLPLLSTDLLAFLERLPSTVRSVELVQLYLLPEPPWREMLQDMKDKLKWTGNKPKVTVAFGFPSMPWRKVWVSDAIARFLDGQGENPFREKADAVEQGKGFGTIREDFDESVNEPF